MLPNCQLIFGFENNGLCHFTFFFSWRSLGWTLNGRWLVFLSLIHDFRKSFPGSLELCPVNCLFSDQVVISKRWNCVIAHLSKTFYSFLFIVLGSFFLFILTQRRYLILVQQSTFEWTVSGSCKLVMFWRIRIQY